MRRWIILALVAVGIYLVTRRTTFARLIGAGRTSGNVDAPTGGGPQGVNEKRTAGEVYLSPARDFVS